MADTIVTIDRLQVRRSSTPGYRPGQNGSRPLADGEEFVNFADGIRQIGDGTTSAVDLPEYPLRPGIDDVLGLPEAIDGSAQRAANLGDLQDKEAARLALAAAANIYRQPAAGAVELTVPQTLDLISSPRKFGAIADGQPHPLGQRYSTLAAAQAVYPFVTALTQQIDWAACQAAANAALYVNFDPLTYVMGSDRVVTANRGIGYLGKGAAKLVFLFGAGGGFSHTDNRTAGAGAAARGAFTFSTGATFMTTVANGGTTISVDMRNAAANPAQAVYGGPLSVRVSGLQFCGDDDFAGQGQHFWNCGIELIDTGTAYIERPIVLGAFTKPNTTGIRIKNVTGANTEFFITCPVMKYVEKYLEIIAGSRTLEGVYITDPSCVGARVAVEISGVLHSLRVSGGHLDAKEAILRAGATTRGSGGWMTESCFMQLSGQYDGTFAADGCLFDLDGQVHLQARGNHVISFDPQKRQTGVRAAGCAQCSFEGNHWLGFKKVFDFPANSAGTPATNCTVDGNNIYQNCTTIADDPLAGSTNYIERIGTGWAEYACGRETRSEIISVTTDADGVAAIPYKKQMKRSPTHVSAQIAGFGNAAVLASNVTCDGAGATVDSFRIVLRPSPGVQTFQIAYTVEAERPTPQ